MAQTRIPRGDLDIYKALSTMFRAGQVYAFAYENGAWSTWTTEHDWRHTVRNGQRRCSCCAPEMSPAGSTDWQRDRLVTWLGLDQPKAKRPGKAEAVAMLRRILDGTDWSVVEVEALVAAA